MEIDVGGKDMKICLEILDHTGSKSKIGQHVLKVVHDNIRTILQDVSHKEINQNTEDGLLLKLGHDVDLRKI